MLLVLVQRHNCNYTHKTLKGEFPQLLMRSKRSRDCEHEPKNEQKIWTSKVRRTLKKITEDCKVFEKWDCRSRIMEVYTFHERNFLKQGKNQLALGNRSLNKVSRFFGDVVCTIKFAKDWINFLLSPNKNCMYLNCSLPNRALEWA